MIRVRVRVRVRVWVRVRVRVRVRGRARARVGARVRSGLIRDDKESRACSDRPGDDAPALTNARTDGWTDRQAGGRAHIRTHLKWHCATGSVAIRRRPACSTSKLASEYGTTATTQMSCAAFENPTKYPGADPGPHSDGQKSVIATKCWPRVDWIGSDRNEVSRPRDDRVGPPRAARGSQSI